MVSRARHPKPTLPEPAAAPGPVPRAASAAATARSAQSTDAAPTPAPEVVRGADRAALLLQKTRRQLLAALHEPDSAAGLARKLGAPRQRLNYHLRQLEQEGLVELVEERRKGNCVERVVRATARAYVISPEALGPIGA